MGVESSKEVNSGSTHLSELNKLSLFKNLNKISTYNTEEFYKKIRKELKEVGIENFKKEMLQKGEFVVCDKSLINEKLNDFDCYEQNDLMINPNNIFIKLITTPQPYGNLLKKMQKKTRGKTHWYRTFSILENKKELSDGWDDPNVKGASMSKYHKFLLPRRTNWSIFNVLTLGMETEYSLENDLNMLELMKECALEFAKYDGAGDNIGLFFHCWPNNSVNFLHLHILDMDNLGPTYYEYKNKNLSIDTVIKVIKEESDKFYGKYEE